MTLEFNEYIIKKIEPELIKDLVYLFDVVYDRKITEQELIDRNTYCHGDNKFIGFIAYHKDSGEPASSISVYPVYVIYKVEQSLVAQAGDLMTHPNHRKKGLFLELSRITFEYCKSIGVELIFGFPNTNSFPAFIKHLGFTQLPNLINYNLFENKFEVARFSSKLNFISKIHKKYLMFLIFCLSNKGATIANSNSRISDEVAYINHNELYHKLKEKDNKLFVRIKGMTVWLCISDNAISIGDIDLNNPEKLVLIIKRLKFIILLSGYRFLTFVSSSNSYIARYIDKYSRNTTESYKLIFYNFSSKIPFDKFSFLESDVDVF